MTTDPKNIDNINAEPAEPPAELEERRETSPPLTLTRGAYAYPGTSLNYKTGDWRVQKPIHAHNSAPCHSACPAGEDAQAYLAKVEEGKLQEAWETIVAVNPLPAVTGRVCHHPCESACNRGQYDEAIAIHYVERYLGDEAIRNNWAYPVKAPARSAPQMAVVGAGPAGLSTAYHLLRQGYRVSLFDEMPVAGGTLQTALPHYRLPRDILEAEVGRVLALGIDFHPHRRLGRDISLAELQSQYQAVFLGPGLQLGREWNVDGVVPGDLRGGLDLLKEWVAIGEIPVPESLAIVGGGNTAVDLARVYKRAGAKEVYIITHQSLPGNEDKTGQNVMSAVPTEINQALEEGVQIHSNRGIRRLLLRGERVVGVEMVRMKKLDRGNGKFERVAFTGTETVLHVDQVIPAIGQVLDVTGMETLLGSESLFSCNLWGEIHHRGIFIGGDARHGSSGTVSGAIGDGRRAALAMHRFHQGEANPENDRLAVNLEFTRLNMNYFANAPRPRPDCLPLSERKGNEEVDKGLAHKEAFAESQRCLSCGNCFACDNCWTLCPDSAVLKTKEITSDGSHYVFDYDYCKGCGLCAKECPCGYIEMVEEL